MNFLRKKFIKTDLQGNNTIAIASILANMIKMEAASYKKTIRIIHG